jgi:putative DNA primase/helicase
VVRVEGEDLQPRKFSTWTPIAFACIGKLPGTIEDRSITIQLRRRRRDEKVDRLRRNRIGHFHEAASRAARWATDNATQIASLDPEISDQLHDRAADNWRPLLAIADLAGDDWPERARRAAMVLSSEAASDQDSIRTLLLADIRTAFQIKRTDRMSSSDIVVYLEGLDERPWSEFKRGKHLTKTGLARLLAPFKIYSTTIRLDGDRTSKGYFLSGFEDTFDRYLPPQTVTT